MTYIVDASVAIKWFVRENLRNHAMALLNRHGGDLEAPDLLLAEVGNIAWKKCRRGEMTTEQCRLALAGTEDCLSALHPMPLLVPRALAIALALGHPIYDCVYIACAEATGRTFVTADERLTRAIGGTEFDYLVRHLGSMGN
ncbi:MAG: type II toxin-antitoxin system VapC family toxin [Hyphomicrobiales bacterium]|nr:type II toxin-antitoxin system VapC family toxin [Hyphomicrobiales bacterium]